MTYFVRGLDRPILRQTQLETYERKVIQTHSMAAVNCTQRRSLLAIAKCIAWHVHSGEPNMPNRERSGCATKQLKISP